MVCEYGVGKSFLIQYVKPLSAVHSFSEFFRPKYVHTNRADRHRIRSFGRHESHREILVRIDKAGRLGNPGNLAAADENRTGWIIGVSLDRVKSKTDGLEKTNQAKEKRRVFP